MTVENTLSKNIPPRCWTVYLILGRGSKLV